MKSGFTFSNSDPNLYFKVDREKPIILVLYVDVLFLTGANPIIHQYKRELASNLEMKNLGPIYYFLGLEVWQRPVKIFLSQGKNIVKLLEIFSMVECVSAQIYLRLK